MRDTNRAPACMLKPTASDAQTSIILLIRGADIVLTEFRASTQQSRLPRRRSRPVKRR